MVDFPLLLCLLPTPNHPQLSSTLVALALLPKRKPQGLLNPTRHPLHIARDGHAHAHAMATISFCLILPQPRLPLPRFMSTHLLRHLLDAAHTLSFVFSPTSVRCCDHWYAAVSTFSSWYAEKICILPHWLPPSTAAGTRQTQPAHRGWCRHACGATYVS